MKFQVEVALACVLSLIWIQQFLCVADELSDTSVINKWTCSCSSAYQWNQSFDIPSNCSSSCDCSPAAEGSSGNKWICVCAADKFPVVVSDGHDASCFTSCNCNSGSSNDSQSSKKRFSSKVVVIIVLLFLLLITLAFIASVLYYIYRRDRCPIQRPLFSLGNESTYSSGTTNLTNSRTTSVPEFRVYIGSPAKHVTGCINKALFLFRSRTGTVQGTIIQFSYSELESATNNFSVSNLIGVGGSSQVYRGHLIDGRIVAVKRMKTLGGPDAESALLKEIELISRLHHCHVVTLIGYCSEYHRKHAERLLVFEYMPNGNLRECLDTISGKVLDWGARVEVALGAARGLEYLHEAAAPRILHRDVKSTNILLDGSWRAKITDLGMAKHLRSDGLPSCPSSPARMQGTFGYFAPEYAIIGRASVKSDVFSFGVVLLELITGRQPIHKSADKGEESLVIWAMPCLQDSRRVISELPDPRLKGDFPEEEMQIMAYLAKECLLLEPELRPTMSEVVQILSTVASEKSRRRNFPKNIFRSWSARAMKSEAETGTPNLQVEGPTVFDELRGMSTNQWSPHCSLPIDRTLCAANDEREYIERVIVLTSNPRSCRSQDGEALDLTEPRLESFQVGDIAITSPS
ncbi:hypothetical protein LguiB_001040 [Lonicera macranthoides]